MYSLSLPLSLLCCCMNYQSILLSVIQFSCVDLMDGLEGHKPELYVTIGLYCIMATAIGLKFALWVYCARLNVSLQSDSLGTYCYCCYLVYYRYTLLSNLYHHLLSPICLSNLLTYLPSHNVTCLPTHLPTF